MRKVLFNSLLVLVLLSTFMIGLVSAKGNKVDICHREGNGSYHLINVNENAVDAHINHGDALPGDPVPDMPGYQFDESCVPVQAGLPAGCYVGSDNSLLWSGGTGPGNGDFYPFGNLDCSGPRLGYATYVVADSLAEAETLCQGDATQTGFHPLIYHCDGTEVYD